MMDLLLEYMDCVRECLECVPDFMGCVLECIALGIGYVYGSYLAIYFVTKIPYRLVRNRESRKKTIPKSSVEEMPVLRPIAIPSKERRRLSRLMVWMHQERHWELVENWSFFLPDGAEIVIPKGFTFNGASVPRPLWWLLSPTGLILIQSLIHDYAYRYDQLWEVRNGRAVDYRKGAGRKYWDDLFRKTGGAVNGMNAVNFLAWLLGLRLWGWRTWRKRRRKSERITKPDLGDGSAPGALGPETSPEPPSPEVRN